VKTDGDSSHINCKMCGQSLSKGQHQITKVFDNVEYVFDSNDCVLIFEKLREVHGKNFFEQ
jgi:transcription elongation factor Elf1